MNKVRVNVEKKKFKSYLYQGSVRTIPILLATVNPLTAYETVKRREIVSGETSHVSKDLINMCPHYNDGRIRSASLENWLM